MKDKRTLIDRETIIIEVRGNEFPISFISNYMIREYSKVLEESTRAYSLYNTYKKAEKDKDKKRMSELEAAIRDIDKMEYFKRRNELLKEILSENGIEFDSKWWDRKTGPDDIMGFLNEAINKDTSKKKAGTR